ncbi:MAG: pyruvate formate lyase-activating protein [Lachnospiraceae bacterium]|nr:pyruvate formate lyase-activating protein [Lachnospiraceae bacterium]MBP5564917.1 pyruvate formate lyase-activating protein [Lachnospiraceae bacterium]
MLGRIHSIETFGAVDGPGVRFVVFFQGCPMRCAYCHNPDTWDVNGGIEMSVDGIYDRFERNKAFYTNGGITASGGEPMYQIEFLIELFKKFHDNGVHTCLDTSGIMFTDTDANKKSKIDTLMDYTDLVMLDIKQIDRDKHKELTGHYNDNVLSFAKYLSDNEKKIWVRFVCVPGVTDDDEDLVRYGKFLGKLKTLKALDVLPYHTMGIKKYEGLGIPYRLEGIEPPNKEYVKNKKDTILNAMKD